MSCKVHRKLFLGFMQLHILHHAKKEPFFGAWMIEELKYHGYDISPGTLYPILHNMEKDGLIIKEESLVSGKVRKYYKITQLGEEILEEGKQKAKELFNEIID
ncbi:PadR family transcriptional regulator [Natranaerobius thermophilus]|uniref:Transcriptional regulator, PadR family n=1 Tax=Natranaerobius thermophilus (strain ATCC BAA-1301 / DSM 18059 / JW/NM-WN-LF) TaxID=457570 RepID=B2A1I4_NATTJ|nr:PadR family transcriptional regulator [Natranaerobius thermophilus]ACB84724.1 transcriptional regulator, PadR family [Natranaerobius thermophilus JW/NM-WN-LF]